MSWIKNVFLLSMILISVGCNRRKNEVERHVSVISNSSVTIKDTPAQPSYDPTSWRLVSYLGNIDPSTSRLSKIDDSFGCSLTVFIKRTDNSDWEEIQTYDEFHDVPRYTHDPITHEIRFQGCAGGWGYTVFVLNNLQY